MTNIFQGICDSVILILLVLMQINCNSCQTYDGRRRGLYASIPTDIPDAMEKISLDNNEISHINDESFNEASTNFSKVENLRLHSNKIENVSERAFVGFHNIKIINLGRNQLYDILLYGDDIPRLETLSLWNNQLTKMPTFYGFFQYFETLRVSINLISHVSEEDFENITNIKSIYLSHDGLVSFEPKQELVRLEHLYLGYNKLTDVPSLKGMYNYVRRINVENNKIPVESLLTLNEKLNGSEHSLTELHMGANADLSNNLSDVITFLKQFPKLIKVVLPKSNINKIFHLTNRLGWLDLSYNNISQITKENFNVSYRYDAFTLILDGNPIEMLPNLYEYLKDFNANETTIHLFRIRFHCGNLCWMTETGWVFEKVNSLKHGSLISRWYLLR